MTSEREGMETRFAVGGGRSLFDCPTTRVRATNANIRHSNRQAPRRRRLEVKLFLSERRSMWLVLVWLLDNRAGGLAGQTALRSAEEIEQVREFRRDREVEAATRC